MEEEKKKVVPTKPPTYQSQRTALAFGRRWLLVWVVMAVIINLSIHPSIRNPTFLPFGIKLFSSPLFSLARFETPPGAFNVNQSRLKKVSRVCEYVSMCERASKY